MVNETETPEEERRRIVRSRLHNQIVKLPQEQFNFEVDTEETRARGAELENIIERFIAGEIDIDRVRLAYVDYAKAHRVMS